MEIAKRDALTELVTLVRKGRLSRRSFLVRTALLGLSTTTATSLLASCGDSPTAPIYLVWQSEYDISGVYQRIVDDFNDSQTAIHVIFQLGPGGSSDQTAIERNMLRSHSTAVDIFSIDVTTPPEFAQQKWLVPITEAQWPLSERQKYLSSPLEACMYQEKLWAVPFRMDVGLIYYRTDIINTPPNSWEELTAQAREHMDAQHKGYVWEAAQYEGLVCNFDEVLHGFGGSVLDPEHDQIVTVNSPEAEAALNLMVSWIGTISPSDISTYTEEVARKTWEMGEAIFMRNWPYAYPSTQKTDYAHKFAIHPMLYGGSNRTGHSCIGGWQLAINAAISRAQQEAAWQFIHYMISEPVQKLAALQAGWIVTHQDVYRDKELLTKYPYFKELTPILKTALPRPRTPKYDALSTALRIHIRQALTTDRKPVPQVLKELASDLTTILTS
ncbi:ABC transporter substrate-binding protein [Tengunoibacter tsumagoiensis]|uniref:Putative ABC transporter-binding protein n=1 Tax=Tengunoibacter tsumagoiensis TaxID=2014871 RepID=A0A401ZXG3_9CHLR|nr:ABC transporter substrate-binding protein [Tengunoibacter tsumagoiensis]GCE11525.1 putative ABC transporter-binding protein [Tengunoibacter tsumagoiensis]